jgi:DNA polymerase (family 10)
VTKDSGVMIVTFIDAHVTRGIGHIRSGVEQARHSRLEAAEVLNTRVWHDIATILLRG